MGALIVLTIPYNRPKYCFRGVFSASKYILIQCVKWSKIMPFFTLDASILPCMGRRDNLPIGTVYFGYHLTCCYG